MADVVNEEYEFVEVTNLDFILVALVGLVIGFLIGFAC